MALDNYVPLPPFTAAEKYAFHSNFFRRRIRAMQVSVETFGADSRKKRIVADLLLTLDVEVDGFLRDFYGLEKLG